MCQRKILYGRCAASLCNKKVSDYLQPKRGSILSHEYAFQYRATVIFDVQDKAFTTIGVCKPRYKMMIWTYRRCSYGSSHGLPPTH